MEATVQKRSEGRLRVALALLVLLLAAPSQSGAAEDLRSVVMAKGDVTRLVTDYLKAVDRRDFAAVTSMLSPDFTFDGPGAPSVTGPGPYAAALRRIAPITVRNDVKRVWVDGDEACVIYDLVTDTRAGALPSVEWVTVRGGKISRIRLIFHTQPWAAALEELKTRPAV